MKKQDLENLYQLTGEIQDIERQLGKLEAKGRWEYVGDTVRDYRSGQGVPITIRGYAESTYNRQAKLINKLQTKREYLIKRKMQIEEELECIEEVVIRRIIRLRYFDRLSWEAVAIAIDGTKSGKAMLMKLDRYLEKNKKN
ncbi:MAG: hypothetical protein AB9836_06040 [Aminipila sp.]